MSEMIEVLTTFAVGLLITWAITSALLIVLLLVHAVRFRLQIRDVRLLRERARLLRERARREAEALDAIWMLPPAALPVAESHRVVLDQDGKPLNGHHRMLPPAERGRR